MASCVIIAAFDLDAFSPPWSFQRIVRQIFHTHGHRIAVSQAVPLLEKSLVFYKFLGLSLPVFLNNDLSDAPGFVMASSSIVMWIMGRERGRVE
jgi:hypothetical protein